MTVTKTPAAAMLGSACPFFIVGDLRAAVAFYRDKLGFAVTFSAPDHDPFFAIVARDGAQFLLKAVAPDVTALPNRRRHADARWDAFVYVAEPDLLAAEFGDRGVTFDAPLADTDDGLRGFELTDNDEYLIFFGCPR